MEKIIITGCSGFIGFHLCSNLLKDSYEIYGIDSLNNYYDVKLKEERLKILNLNKNFTFKKINLEDKELLSSVFKTFKPDKVVNLAAQAGVRYSVENPYVYVNSNIVGFLNIIEECRQSNVKGFIYASSSSVYGGNKKIPFSETDQTKDPLSLYGATKLSNELIANSYTRLYGLKSTGLRFFTVYGPWGRPDMAMYIFANKITNNKPISVFNNGKMKRDFTYIDDVISGIKAAIKKNYKLEIFNLGNNSSENIMDMIKIMEVELGKKAMINFLPMQMGDVKESFADIFHSQKYLNYEPKTSIQNGIPKFIDWYKSYHI